MLYIVATPIGNLEDISQRALKVLRQCDAILCEDTRRSSILLNHFGIAKPLIPYHKFNEAKSLERILQDLGSGKTFSLITDAGTPCINDPGGRLVAGCIEHQIPFTSIPGPCSPIQALVLSGFIADRFQFIGFLPKKPESTLRGALFYPGITIAFESPERVLKTLEILQKLDPLRNIAVAREMTKVFEECQRGTAEQLFTHFHVKGVRGEISLVIAQGEPPTLPLCLEECVELLREVHHLSLKDAIKQAARLLKIQKRLLYKKMHVL